MVSSISLGLSIINATTSHWIQKGIVNPEEVIETDPAEDFTLSQRQRVEESEEKYRAACQKYGVKADQYIIDALFAYPCKLSLEGHYLNPQPMDPLTLSSEKEANRKIQALAEFLRTDTWITELDLAGGMIGDLGAIVIAEALQENSTITQISFHLNDIGNEGAIAIAQMLSQNQNITDLNLGSNSIGDEGAIALADALGNYPALATLGLGFNWIGDEGTIALASAIAKNPSLTEIDLAMNEFGDRGAGALADAISTNTSLKKAYVGFNDFTEVGRDRLINAETAKKYQVYLFIERPPKEA
ncbi:MAG: hypothetical protein HQ596_08310 [Candidatus Saganbacteria bacterium]|nr:hypothetical protein [Candidatus Saganbacteria bacterium]